MKRARTVDARPTIPAAPPAAWTSLLVGLAVFAVYAVLAPSVAGDKDSSEFILVLARLGTPHPTGYPLYTLLGHAFVTALHALGVGWDRAGNLWSAFGGAAAMGLLHALAARLLAREGVGARSAVALALLPVAAFALNPLVTMETTLAEVNAFHLAWVAGAMLVTLWAGDRLRRAEATPADVVRVTTIAGLVLGSGLAHHATSVFVIVPMALALALQAREAKRLSPTLMLVAAVAIVLPWSANLWTAWRVFHPVEPHWQALTPTWQAWWRHVTGADYRIYLGHFAPSEVQRNALAAYLWPWLAVSAACAGVWAWRGRGTPGAVRAAWLVSGVAAFAYARSYGVGDPSSYFLPSFLLAVAAVPAALVPLRAIARPLAALVGLALLVQDVTWFRVGMARAQVYRAFEGQVLGMWRAIPFDDGFVLWPSDMVHRLHKYQWLDGDRPGIEALNPIALTHDGPHAAFVARHGFDPADRARLEARMAANPPADPRAFSQALGLAIIDELNEHTSKPVVRFRPEVPELVLLDKPSPDTTATRR
ncbi:MAG: hypothetical protein RL760_1428 [Candidatus Eisenbacteria bacterium]